jgi:hypothetical protein
MKMENGIISMKKQGLCIKAVHWKPLQEKPFDLIPEVYAPTVYNTLFLTGTKRRKRQ